MAPHATWEVDHIGIAVRSLEEAIALYSRSAHTEVTLRETLPNQGVELAFLNTAGSKLELLAPLTKECALARSIEKRGPGLHHVCYRVSDISAELTRLAATGYDLIDTTPRPGAGGTQIAFISPRSFLGVLTELCEYPKGSVSAYP
jgi:methylmalonyl-CoA/ethylmalonyl-CoA epimerase